MEKTRHLDLANDFAACNPIPVLNVSSLTHVTEQSFSFLIVLIWLQTCFVHRRTVASASAVHKPNIRAWVPSCTKVHCCCSSRRCPRRSLLDVGLNLPWSLKLCFPASGDWNRELLLLQGLAEKASQGLKIKHGYRVLSQSLRCADESEAATSISFGHFQSVAKQGR